MPFSEFQFAKLISDAACKLFIENGKEFPDFNTMGIRMSETILERADFLGKIDQTAKRKYFKIESQAFNFSVRVDNKLPKPEDATTFPNMKTWDENAGGKPGVTLTEFDKRII